MSVLAELVSVSILTDSRILVWLAERAPASPAACVASR